MVKRSKFTFEKQKEFANECNQRRLSLPEFYLNIIEYFDTQFNITYASLIMHNNYLNASLSLLNRYSSSTVLKVMSHKKPILGFNTVFLRNKKSISGELNLKFKK